MTTTFTKTLKIALAALTPRVAPARPEGQPVQRLLNLFLGAESGLKRLLDTRFLAGAKKLAARRMAETGEPGNCGHHDQHPCRTNKLLSHFLLFNDRHRPAKRVYDWIP